MLNDVLSFWPKYREHCKATYKLFYDYISFRLNMNFGCQKKTRELSTISIKFHFVVNFLQPLLWHITGASLGDVASSPWVSTAFGLVHPSRVSRQLQKAHQSSALKIPKHQNGKGWKYKTPSCWLLYNGDIMDMNGELYWYIGTCHLLPCGMLCCSITSVVPLGFNYVKKSSESANHCNWRSQQTFLQHLPGLRSTCNGPPDIKASSWSQRDIIQNTAPSKQMDHWTMNLEESQIDT